MYVWGYTIFYNRVSREAADKVIIIDAGIFTLLVLPEKSKRRIVTTAGRVKVKASDFSILY